MTSKNRLSVLSVVFAAVSSAAFAADPVVEESLCDFRLTKKVSWCPKRVPPEKSTYGCRFELNGKHKVIHQILGGYWFPAYTASEKVRVSFMYRGDVDKVEFILDLRRPNEKPLPGQVKTPYIQKKLPLAPGWNAFSIDVDWPALDFWGNYMMRVAAYGDGKERHLELKDIVIRELPPERPEGRPLVIGGTRATEVAILETGDELGHQEDLRAARMFRYILYRNGGDYLPVRTAKSVDEIAPAAVLVGRAAEMAGVLSGRDAETVRKANSGSCAFRVKGTRLGITGELPVGVAYGVFAFWREIGVEYLGNMKWRRPDGDAFAAADGFGRAIEPAVAFRGDCYRNELGLMPELRGRSYILRSHCHYSEGCWLKDISCDHNFCSGLVSIDEFAKTRPDFFAMRKDGSRMTDVKPWIVQYCMSNRDLMELTAARVLEMMRIHPEHRIFPISPGDGSGNYCKCPECSKRPITDIWLSFVNFIAERTSKEFPRNYIDMSIYADSIRPPENVKPHPNVSGHYCPYIRHYWPSCMLYEDPANDEGWKQIKAWRKLFPRMRLVLYPSQCGENLNMWPSFDSDNRIIAEFARNRAMSVRYFTYSIARGGTMPQTPGFCDLRIYVSTRIEEDPSYDPVKGAHGFIRDFYGAAAPEMTAYFELFRKEAARRRWIQNCEQHLKGFVTREFADRCLPLLDAAEAKLKDDPVNLPAVLHEKQSFLWTYLDGWNRGSGNVAKEDFPLWARLVADFCRICRDTDTRFLSYKGFDTWMREIAFVEIKTESGECWFDKPEINAVIADPEKGLGGDCPTLQKAVPGGYEIPARGMVGAQFLTSTWRRKDAVEERVLRRPSSGFGLAMTRLNLRKKPAKDMTVRITGIDNDHPPVAEMEIAVNGKSVYRGKVPFRKDVWQACPFTVPAALLQKGDNEIVLRNVTGDGDEKDGDCGEMFRAKHNYYWGWYAVEKMTFEVVE